jgi:hypothetical protein
MASAAAQVVPWRHSICAQERKSGREDDINKAIHFYRQGGTLLSESAISFQP